MPGIPPAPPFRHRLPREVAERIAASAPPAPPPPAPFAGLVVPAPRRT